MHTLTFEDAFVTAGDMKQIGIHRNYNASDCGDRLIALYRDNCFSLCDAAKNVVDSPQKNLGANDTYLVRGDFAVDRDAAAVSQFLKFPTEFFRDASGIVPSALVRSILVKRPVPYTWSSARELQEVQKP